jgi:hypothetical protein
MSMIEWGDDRVALNVRCMFLLLRTRSVLYNLLFVMLNHRLQAPMVRGGLQLMFLCLNRRLQLTYFICKDADKPVLTDKEAGECTDRAAHSLELEVSH